MELKDYLVRFHGWNGAESKQPIQSEEVVDMDELKYFRRLHVIRNSLRSVSSYPGL